MNPFDLIGAEFLGFYIVLFIVGLIVANVLRWNLRGPGGALERLDNLTPYEIAYLARGAPAAIDACLVRLIHHHVLGLDADGWLTRLKTRVPDHAHELEKTLASTVANKPAQSAEQIRTLATPNADKIRARLETLGLLVTPDRNNLIRVTSAGVMAGVVLVGLLRCGFGAINSRAFEFLALLLLISVVPIILFLKWRFFRTRRGDETLRQLRYENDALKTVAGPRSNELSDADLIIALGLFGPAVLAGGPHANLMPRLQQPRGDSSSGSSGGCSSCGGSSCGSDGGSCGGGGCGGCGGGGD